MVDHVPKRFRSLVLSSGSFTTKANASHVCTTAKEDAGMEMNVAFVISAQQNRSGRGRVDNITWRELSEENETVPKHKDKSVEVCGSESRKSLGQSRSFRSLHALVCDTLGSLR